MGMGEDKQFGLRKCIDERLDLLVLRLNLDVSLVKGGFENRVKFMYGDKPSNRDLVNAYECVVRYYESRVK